MDATALLERLRADDLRIAVAESCTGGMLQAALVDVPGSSNAFLGGVVAYADDVKVKLLDVEPNLIEGVGSVSASVAEDMAHGIRDRTGADMAIAVTGIAGPDGGTEGKPVGTVWLAVLGPDHVINAHRLQLDGDRSAIRRATVTEALAHAMANIDEWEKERA